MKKPKLKDVLELFDKEVHPVVRSVYRSLDAQQIADLVKYGINGGFAPYIYYEDTCKFAFKFKKEINQMLDDLAWELGETKEAVVRSFKDSKDFDWNTVYRFFAQSRPHKDDSLITINIFCWYAVEEVCNRIYDLMYEKGLLKD